jgi:hypothetical protein
MDIQPFSLTQALVEAAAYRYPGNGRLMGTSATFAFTRMRLKPSCVQALTKAGAPGSVSATQLQATALTVATPAATLHPFCADCACKVTVTPANSLDQASPPRRQVYVTVSPRPTACSDRQAGQGTSIRSGPTYIARSAAAARAALSSEFG